MPRRTIKVAEFETVEQPEEGKTQVIAVEVSYSLGGMDYFDYEVKPRGYWLHVRLETIDKTATSGIRFRSFMLFSAGLKAFLEETSRFSAKRLGELAAGIRKAAEGDLDETFPGPRIYKRLLEAVLTKHGVTLKEPVAA